MSFGIYQILNTGNGKRYVGSTGDVFLSRWKNHRCALRKGRHDNPKLQSAFNKYGENAFEFSILEEVTIRDEVLVVEQRYLDTYVRWGFDYNLNSIAAKPPSTTGRKHSEEAKAKISAANTGHKHSEETKEKMGVANIGTKHRLGKKHSEEAKSKMSSTRIGRKPSEETKSKMSATRMGHKQPEEVKEKLRIANIGKKHSEETKAKLRKAWEKRKLSAIITVPC
jgi:group I intron endonuclease